MDAPVSRQAAWPCPRGKTGTCEVIICCCWVPQSCPTLCDPMDCSTPGFPVLHYLLSLLKLLSIESVSRPLLLSSIFPSIKVFSNETTLCIMWPKYWSFSFSIGPSNEYSELISFRIDWFNLLAVQGTLKSLLQHHSSKASILQHSACITVQLSHPYVTTGKTVSSVAQSCPTLCHPVDCRMPGCLSLSPRVCSHPTILPSVACLSSCPQSFPASGSFLMSSLFASHDESIGALASASVLPMNIQGWFLFRIYWCDLLVVQQTLKSLLQHHSSKASIF